MTDTDHAEPGPPPTDAERIRDLETKLARVREAAAVDTPPWIRGHCPACGTPNVLFVGDGGHITCSLDTCPNPDAASTFLGRRSDPSGGNAEDCPRCAGTNLPYPWLCPGHDAPDDRRAQYTAAIRSAHSAWDADVPGSEQVSLWDYLTDAVMAVRDRELNRHRIQIDLTKSVANHAAETLKHRAEQAEAERNELRDEITAAGAQLADMARKRNEQQWYAEDARRQTRVQRERAEQAEATIAVEEPSVDSTDATPLTDFRDRITQAIRDARHKGLMLRDDAMADAVMAVAGRETQQLRAERDDARSWARHGYEIGQRHCGWTDHGVAPAWLTDGWPPHIDSCEHLQRLTQAETAIERARAYAHELHHKDAMGLLAALDTGDAR